MKQVLWSVLFLSVSPAAFASGVVLYHPYGSVHAAAESLCIRNDAFQLKSETMTLCREDHLSRKGGRRCASTVTVTPSRDIRSTERICVKKNPAKNPAITCLKYEERTIELPTTFKVIEHSRDYKHPTAPSVKIVKVPACGY